MYIITEMMIQQIGFNRYMVECEFCDVSSAYECRTAVLIDTWWNVNQDYEISVAGDLFVLIDTWWNVN